MFSLSQSVKHAQLKRHGFKASYRFFSDICCRRQLLFNAAIWVKSAFLHGQQGQCHRCSPRLKRVKRRSRNAKLAHRRFEHCPVRVIHLGSQCLALLIHRKLAKHGLNFRCGGLDHLQNQLVRRVKRGLYAIVKPTQARFQDMHTAEQVNGGVGIFDHP